jgi:hypothetical protein
MSEARPYAVLKQLEGVANEDEIVLVCGENVTVGRGEAADYVIEDSRLSRVHFRLHYHECTGHVKITDLDSRNGLLVNGKKVTEALLQESDKCQVGRELYHFFWRDDDEFDELEGETEVISKLIFCEHCGSSASPIAVQRGDSKSKDGAYLCVDCSTILEVGINTFGAFIVQEKLGAGKTGLVYKALDKKGKRQVALKILRPNPDMKDRHIIRFLQEAAVITKLKHPNIIEVYGAERFDNGYYLILEYFKGDNLSERIRWAGPLDLDKLTSIGVQIARAVSYAGSQGVVHRDIKPANMLYDPSLNLTKLSDFGLAREISPSARRLTREGEGLGTPTYMPPEQMRQARHADHRADVYSVGASLYHMCTGRLPITATSYQQFVSQLLKVEAPPVTDICKDAPESLARAISRCMKKRPEERYQDAAELAADLEATRRELGFSEVE